MSLLDQLSGLLGNVTGGNLSDEETHAHYDQISQAVPQQQLGAAIGSAMKNLDTQDVQSRVANSATQMSSQQKGDVVGALLGALGGSGGGLGALGGLLGQLGVNPDVASNPQSATPEEVGTLAAHAKENDPSVFQRAMSVYSAHPTLVKALGTMAIAEIAKHLANPQR